ncbi:MAG TPA: polyhydroxyalkanoic acid system family protein [Patescibacteria group bacterium]|nr:polyhydroxyalkanoic acid system family protein [Patescibacteria group bacterium]
MATISISRKHKKSMTEARASIDRVAKGMAKKFSVGHEWEGDTLHFSRPGVEGHIALGKGSVKVEATLGFLLMVIKSSVEDEIERYLDEEFG